MFKKPISGPTTNEDVNREIEYYCDLYSKMTDAELENVIRREQMDGNYYENSVRLAEIELRNREKEEKSC